MNNNDEFDPAELRALREAVQSLPREVPPSHASWDIVQHRIEQTRVRELVPVASAGSQVQQDTVAHDETTAGLQRQHSWWRSTRGAALMAATLFIAVTTFVVQGERATDTAPLNSFAADTAGAEMSVVFARYDGAATDLQNDLERRRPTLNPAMVAVLDSCLHTINEAIQETRGALKDAPDNATIAELLEVTYQQKLDLLRRAAELSESF